jgi:hypothetical protein
MAPGLADAVRSQLPTLQPLFKSWGPIKDVTYLGTAVYRIDSYKVDFATGPSAIFNIFLGPDGKAVFLNFQPADPPAPR